LPDLAANLRVIAALGKRSVRQTFRRPQLVAPILVFPSLLLAVQTGGAAGAVNLPGFPDVNGFLDFMLAGAMLQSCLLAGNTGGIALAVDLEMGFTDRLFSAPISRYSIVLGRLAGTAALGLLTSIWFIAVGLIFGVEFEQGIVGMALMVVFISLSAVVFGALSSAIALYTGQASVVQGLFPLIFVILFLSSAFFPAALMLEPAASLAEYNPISFIVEGIRDQVIGGVDAAILAETVAAIAAVGLFSFALSALALRRRLRLG
jgi:ABC-2 type transport system permease protein